MVVLVRDVTLRREADLRIAYLNRVYALLSGINTLIVRVRDRQELFREACRIAVDEGALAMAWIGMLDPDCERIVPVDCAGMPEDFSAAIGSGLNENSVSIPGVSLLYQAIATRTALVSNAPQRDLRVPFSEMHIKHGVRSVAVFPLIIADEAVGVFVLYARERGFFHEAELRLLTGLAGDVAFAVEHIGKQERLDYLAYWKGCEPICKAPSAAATNSRCFLSISNASRI
jgi:GAF domain-containing protein